MNEARLEELKKILNERYQNLEQGSRENSDAQNSDVSKSDNLNLNIKDSLKFQNLHFNDAASRNSKVQTRDYDKDPLIIKNRNQDITIIWIFFICTFMITAIIMEKISSESLCVIVITMAIWINKSNMDNPKDSLFKFTNSAIFHTSENFYKEIRLNEIISLKKTIQALLEVHNQKHKNNKIQKIGNIALFLYLMLIITGLIIINEDKAPIVYIFVIFISGLIMPQYLYHLYTDITLKDKIYDTLIISSKYNFNICIFIASKKDFDKIRKYFLDMKKNDITKCDKILFSFGGKL